MKQQFGDHDLRMIHKGNISSLRAALYMQTPFRGICLSDSAKNGSKQNLDSSYMDTILRKCRVLLASGASMRDETTHQKAITRIMFADIGTDKERDMDLKCEFLRLMDGELPTANEYEASFNSAEQWEESLINDPDLDRRVFCKVEFLLASCNLPASTDPATSPEPEVFRFNMSAHLIRTLEERLNIFFTPRPKTSDVVLCRFPDFFHVEFYNFSELANGKFPIPP